MQLLLREWKGQALVSAEPKKSSQMNDSAKDTLESIVIALILAFVFRAFIVEAFIIPTGSMAPTLLGAHLRFQCEQCGYRFTADPGGDAVRQGKNEVPVGRDGVCPMCRFPNPVRRGTPINSGDRILVHKYMYALVEPRRWDVVVFRYPNEPETNYIKRLVGLPNEELQVIEGNVYTRSLDPRATPAQQAWHIERKTAREKVQRTVWQPIYHNEYMPLDQGDSMKNSARGDYAWRMPWVAVSGLGQWDLKQGTVFRHEGEAAGQIRFDFESGAGHPRYMYNHIHTMDMIQQSAFEYEPLEDMRVAARFVAEKAGLGISLMTTARWGANPQPQGIVATIDGQGHASLSLPATIDPKTGKATVLGVAELGPRQAGRDMMVELWYVDQEASLWVDGQRVIVANFEVEWDLLNARPPLALGTVPDIRMEVWGSPVRVYQVQVDRDFYYGSENAKRAVLHKIQHNRQGSPVMIGLDQFFVLGDNSPLSSDSRMWLEIDPWVSHDLMQGHRLYGIVPRETMIGRAFFVYWPAMWGLSSRSRPIIPNFGDMRFIH